MMERSLILIKPDGVKRGVMGKIISRFEDAGYKIIGAKMAWIDSEFGKEHYADLGQRRGQKVLQVMLKFITSGPVMALVIEGINAVEGVRKLVGGTEPKSAAPGTIRGDFAHVSFAHADQQNKAIENLIHASGSAEEAQLETALWFKERELHSYKNVHEAHTF